MITRIGIIGAGKLGSPMAAALASKGFEVIVCDVDKQKLTRLITGEPPYKKRASESLITDTSRKTTSDDKHFRSSPFCGRDIRSYGDTKQS